MGQKRRLELKTQALQAKKRKPTRAKADKDDSEWDGIVGVDELNWKEVALPDRMEDAGGFLGLEEIDGVDIVRSQGNGQVRFKVYHSNLLTEYGNFKALIENRQYLTSPRNRF